MKINLLGLASLLFFQSLSADGKVCSVSHPKVIVMRHGQAMHNIKDVYNSNPSSLTYVPAPLTEEGKKQALTSAKRLLEEGFNHENIGAVFVSPLPRTMETAHILMETGLFSKDKLHLEPRLIEPQMGELEGKSIIHAWIPSYAEKYKVESDEAIQKRVEQFYQGLLSSPYCGNILVVTHGVPANKLMKLLAPDQKKLSTGEARVFPLK